jgi:hypothetical protein
LLQIYRLKHPSFDFYCYFSIHLKGHLDLFLGVSLSRFLSRISLIQKNKPSQVMRSSLLKHVVVGTFFLVKCTSGHAFILAIDGGNKRRSTGFGTRLTARGNLVQNSGIILQKEITAGETTPCGRIFGGDGLKAFVIDVAQELASGKLVTLLPK